MMGGLGLFGSPVLGRLSDRISYGATWLPAQPVRGQPTNLANEQQSLSTLTPLWQNSENELALTTHVRVDFFQTGAVLPTSGIAFPKELYNIGLGGTYRHLFDNGWIWGISTQVGSASDEPFHSVKEMNLGLSTFVRVPWGDRDAWLFSLSYSPTAQIPIPIPGVAYSWVPSDRFQANIGLPFMINYRPIDDLLFNLTYTPLTNVRARATYRVCGPVRLYTAYTWGNQGWYLADRTDSRERFLYYDMRVTGGVMATLGGGWTLDLSSGYEFNRYYTQAKQASLNGADRLDIGAGPFLSLNCWFRW
jgi:hypothetical protein